MPTFDLEKAIRDWKKRLFITPGIEESHAAEMEAGLRDAIDELVAGGLGEAEAFAKAAAETAAAEVLGDEFHRARTRAANGRPPWRAPRFMPDLLWHNLKAGLRKIRRHKAHTLINVVGLAAGMASFLLILTAIRFEMSFDRFHDKADRIVRLAIRNTDPGSSDYALSAPEILAGAMTDRIPDVRRTSRLTFARNALLQTESAGYAEEGLFADERFFSLFSFDLVRGAPADVLKAPGSIVVREELAVEIFGTADPVGRRLRYKDRFLEGELTVSGIVRRPPLASHLQFRFLISLASLAANKATAGWFNEWSTYAFIIYAELADPRVRAAVEDKASALYREARPDVKMAANPIYLQPLTDIRLKSRIERAASGNDRIQTVRLYGAVALLVLLIACVNAMNLATALAATRSKEVGIRKVAGASRGQLVRQFLGESYLQTAAAMALSLALFFGLFPVFGRLLGSGLTWQAVEAMPLALSILATILLVGALSGFYPALVLSAQRPQAILKGGPLGTRRNGVRNLLVIFQFAIVGALLIGTIVVGRQLRYGKTKDLGYRKEQVVVVPLKYKEVVQAAGVIKERFLSCPGVVAAAASNGTPLKITSFLGGNTIDKGDGTSIKIDHFAVSADADFVPVYGMRILQGRGFRADYASDAQKVLVNEAFVRAVGWTKPLERKVNDFPVLGVVKDFHFDSLHAAIEPLVIYNSPATFGTGAISLRIQPGDPTTVLAALREAFSQAAARQPFDYYFLDDALNQAYRAERGLASLIGMFVALAAVLGCIGLFGLASHAIKRRVKEIGIRKVLGAPVGSLVGLISREFLILVAAANLIAWPVGYAVLKRWLQGYAYHCPMGIDIFLLTGLATLAMALLAVGVHTLKAARSNPVDSLRYE